MTLKNSDLHDLFTINLRRGHRELRWQDGTWVPFGYVIQVRGESYRTNEIFHCMRNHLDAHSCANKPNWPPSV